LAVRALSRNTGRAGHRWIISVLVVLFALGLCAAVGFAQSAAGEQAATDQNLSSSASPGESDTWLGSAYRAFGDIGNWLLVGAVLLLGRLVGRSGSRLHLPMVVGYLLFGVVLGRSALNVINEQTAETLNAVTDLGLGVVAFMIGTELSRRLIRRLGVKLIIIMVAESLGAFVLVALLVWGLSVWVGVLPAGLAVAGALIFGAMAPASAPAGTVAVIQEYRARGPLTSLLTGVVGLDDAFAIAIYAFAATVAKLLLSAEHISVLGVLEGPTLEILGGLALGAVVGFVLLVLLRRRRDDGDVLVYALGAILLTSGLASVLGLSLILANLAVGAVLANLSLRDTEVAYNRIEQVAAPIYVLFFVVAGAHLDVGVLRLLGMLGPVYIIGRTLGLVAGAYVGCSLARTEPTTRRYLGLGILSQAGVAVGLALTVAGEFRAPEYGPLGRQLAQLTINTIAATTIIFEIIGPITTKFALSRAGEIGRARAPEGVIE